MMNFKKLVCKCVGHSLDSVEAERPWLAPNRKMCGRCGCMMEKKQVKKWEYAGQTWFRYGWVEVSREQLVAETLMKEESQGQYGGQGSWGGNQGWQGYQGVTGAVGVQGYQGVDSAVLQGPMGHQGSAGLKITGVAGSQGWQGMTGASGQGLYVKSDTIPGLKLSLDAMPAKYDSLEVVDAKQHVH